MAILLLVKITAPDLNPEELSFHIPRQVWAIYTGWWGNPAVLEDGTHMNETKYNESNHRIWSHWRTKKGRHWDTYNEPPLHIGAFHYPRLGLYSSHDISVLRQHCLWLREAGIDMILFQWWGRHHPDINSPGFAQFTTDTIPLLLEAAKEFDLNFAIAIMGYENRTDSSILDDIQFISEKFSTHSNYMKMAGRPLIVIYDSHDIKNLYVAIEKLRKSKKSPFLLTNVVESNHMGEAVENGFDGITTWYAAESHTWAATTSGWPNTKRECDERQLFFVPAVGPGYNDERSNDWAFRDKPTRSREGGKYYDRFWKSAIESKPDVILVNSFNHWHEGTGIEPVQNIPGFDFDGFYVDQKPDPEAFLKQTRQWADKFKA